MNGGTADIAYAIKCHNVYDDDARKCTSSAVVNEFC